MESDSRNKRAQAEWEIASQITMHQSKVGKDGNESWYPQLTYLDPR